MLICDHLQIAITLCERTRFAAGHGRRARWNHPLDVLAVFRGRAISGGAVSRHPGDPAFKLIKQGPIKVYLSTGM